MEKPVITTSRLALALTASLMLPAIPAAAAPAARSASSQTEANRRVITAAFARWSAGTGNFFNEVLAPDVVWTIEGSSPSAGVFRGRENFLARAVRPFASRLSTPVRPTDVRVLAEGDDVVVKWEGSGVARDGRAYQNSYAWFFRMQNGRAAAVTAFLDLAPYDDVLRRIPLPSASPLKP